MLTVKHYFHIRMGLQLRHGHAPLMAVLVRGRTNLLVNGMSRPNSNNAIDVWTWYCYDDGGNKNLWASWYHAQSDRTRGQHRQVFEILEQLETWSRPLAKNLAKGLVEIIIRSEVQWRIFGFYWPRKQRRSFTIVLIGNHKGKVYNPPDATKKARNRIRNIENGKSNVRRCNRPKELGEF